MLDMKLEGALDQVSELRRQKTEMLAHADNLWVTLACVAGWGWAWWCGQVVHIPHWAWRTRRPQPLPPGTTVVRQRRRLCAAACLWAPTWV